MKNPWTKKNPFMSMWLSGANSVANRARGAVTAAGRKEATAIATRGMSDMLDYWAKAANTATGQTAKRAAGPAKSARKTPRTRKTR